MITDLEITVRKDGNILLDQLNIGPSGKSRNLRKQRRDFRDR